MRTVFGLSKINILEKTGYKEELLEIVSGVEDNEIRHDLYTYALRRIHRNRENHHVSELITRM